MLFTAHLQNIKSYLLSSKGVAKGVKCIGHTLVLQDINPMTFEDIYKSKHPSIWPKKHYRGSLCGHLNHPSGQCCVIKKKVQAVCEMKKFFGIMWKYNINIFHLFGYTDAKAW